MKKKIYILALACVFMISSLIVYASNNVKEPDYLNLDKIKKPITITDQKQIKEVVKKYHLDPEKEGADKIVYISFNQKEIKKNESLINQIKPRKEIGGQEYYIKNLTTKEGNRNLLRSSWFEAPGGSMSIKGSISVQVLLDTTASIEGGIAAIKGKLSVSLGFDVKQAISFTETQKITVKKGYKRNIKAYLNNKIYNYELWEKDLFFDDYIGKGTVTKHIGIFFKVGKEIKK